uniref:Protein phosphatase methylesterase 1 n=1 Tax=Panstrongylus megistus TaxID=65343 RepID=A0A069DYU3_9HEMI
MSMQKYLFTSKLPPKTGLNSGGGAQSTRRRDMRSKLEFTPVSWDKYFTGKNDVLINGSSFRTYTLGDSGPAIVLLHGGGYSALSWSLLSAKLTELVECQLLALDLRGHGNTSTPSDDDLSIETLANDVVEVINTVYDECTPIILVGHSLGGSIAVHAGHHPNLKSLIGLVVIDVVEGTALSALSSMQSILRGRPQCFNSVEEAIRWSVQSGQLKNIDSARVSMPGQIKNLNTNKLATEEIQMDTPEEIEESKVRVPLAGVESISEEEESQFKVPGTLHGKYGWRIDLRATEIFWPAWFQGLSKLFLSCEAQKLLLLASLDRLDTDLTVAQMQGKFEIHAFEQSRGRCGHAIHEDIPDAVAEVLATYLVRNMFAKRKYEFPSVMPCC